jgi:anti-sigma factor RsiW
MNDEEKFFAWLDGELDPADAAAFGAKVETDPELSLLAAQHRALGSSLHAAFDPIAAAPIPERLQQAARPGADVVDLAAARRARLIPAIPQWTALAATLVIGVMVGTMIPSRSPAPVDVQGGTIYAAAALNHALDTQLASAPSGDVRVGISYRDRAGEVCRTFTQPSSSGLACRRDGRWQLKGLFATGEESGDYRMAAGMDPALASLVDTTIVGEPFDQSREKAARDHGWR